MDPARESHQIQTRRQFFGRAATGIGAAALASLLNPELFAAEGGRCPPSTSRRRRSG